jgi:hypothetical protein
MLQARQVSMMLETIALAFGPATVSEMRHTLEHAPGGITVGHQGAGIALQESFRMRMSVTPGAR